MEGTNAQAERGLFISGWESGGDPAGNGAGSPSPWFYYQLQAITILRASGMPNVAGGFAGGGARPCGMSSAWGPLLLRCALVRKRTKASY